MQGSEFQRRNELLFSIRRLRKGQGMRQEGGLESYVPDIHLNDRVSDWLANRFEHKDKSLDRQNDIVVEVGKNE